MEAVRRSPWRARALVALTLASLTMPAATLAVKPNPTLTAEIRGDCSGLSATMSWSDQRPARGFTLTIVSDTGRDRGVTGAAGSSGSAQNDLVPQADAATHEFQAHAVLVDRRGRIVAEVTSRSVVAGACALPGA